MSVEELYKFWSEDPYFDEATRAELLAIKDDKKEIEERFYSSVLQAFAVSSAQVSTA